MFGKTPRYLCLIGITALFLQIGFLYVTNRRSTKLLLSSSLTSIGLHNSVFNDTDSKPFISFKDYDPHKPHIFNLSALTIDEEYFIHNGQTTCLKEGTRLVNEEKGCLCNKGFYGPWCSFPDSFKKVPFRVSDLKLRQQPRRVIYATPFSIEFEMLEARMAELGDLVELFMVSEGNHTGYGDTKPLRLLTRLKDGYLSYIQPKLSYVYYDNFPKEAFENGWLADDIPRDALGRGLQTQIKDVRHDDIFIMTDTDELPYRSVVLFLKLHDGYPEPMAIAMSKRTYGFFWLVKAPWVCASVCTMGFVSHVFQYKTSKLRNPDKHIPLASKNLNTYLAMGAKVKLWTIGQADNLVGWHCSWCTDVSGMRIKLVSAINADFPRWGDYPEKRELSYIKNLVKKGMWFDGKSTLPEASINMSSYAPNYIMNNWDRYKHLLVNPYRSSSDSEKE